MRKNKDFFRNKMHPYFKSIENSSLRLLKMPVRGGGFNPFAFVNRQFRENKHPGAVDEALKQLIIYYDGVKNPWSYLTAILKTTNGNWNERDHIDRHENVKKEFADFVDKSEELRHLLRDIGR